MSDDTTDRRGGWFKSQLTVTNIVVIGTFLVAVGSWQSHAESRIGDLANRIATLERRVETDATTTYQRRDVNDVQLLRIEGRLANIEERLRALARR